MGKIKHLLKIEELLKKSPVFSSRDVERIVGDKKYAHLFLHNFCKRGKIKRATKGCYSWQDDPLLSVFCFRPAYIGLQEALSFRNLWEQETNLVIITSRKIRTGARRVFGNNVLIYRLDSKYLFGFEYLKYGDLFLPISDIEKIFIDFIYFKENLSPEVFKKIKKMIDLQKLNNYLSKYPPAFRKKVQKIYENFS